MSDPFDVGKLGDIRLCTEFVWFKVINKQIKFMTTATWLEKKVPYANIGSMDAFSAKWVAIEWKN